LSKTLNEGKDANKKMEPT